MRRSGKITIRDIAKRAGVSRSTVSLVINGDPRISDGTKSKVMKIIDEAGFEPNTMARRLARQRSETILVVLPPTDKVLTDFYFAEAISGIAAALSEAGFRLLIEIANDKFLQRRDHMKLYREGAVDGMLIVGATTEDKYVQELLDTKTPLVLVNSRLEGAASVVADNRTGTKEMVEYLASQGHERIAFIGGLEITTSGEDRSIGFREGLEAAGLPFNEDYRLWGNFSEESGEECARKLLARDPKPTALMAANDMMALGAMRVARDEFKLRIPEDLSIVGADGVMLTRYVEPRLTTITQPIFEIGRMATQCLLDALSQGGVPTESLSLPTSIQLGESASYPQGKIRAQ
ncbi:MAG: LacI family DNA-binding transcriptional regulator [Candidatus Eisenbacteria bacterium]|uniref:LacI family DNA-binding transcriptional regulator n=1 Tax=Eiseniibacteriota bacterium TaxID=2212470 RepID=A0A7Y2H396_UNCEI|nr:LacI family DNA-binding transcriptional regulator [Candidatus Eisenbacteria bacterium]